MRQHTQMQRADRCASAPVRSPSPPPAARRDKSAQEFQEYLREMPWWAFDFERPENARLASLCQVQTIPCLVLLDRNGEVITNKAADLHRADPSGAEFPYVPRAIQRLTPIAGPTLNTVPCVVAFVDGGRRNAAAHAEEVMAEAAEAEFAKGAGRTAHFFVADAQSEFCQQVMQVRRALGSAAPAAISHLAASQRARCTW